MGLPEIIAIVFAFTQSWQGVVVMALILLIFAVFFREELQQFLRKTGDDLRRMLFGSKTTAKQCPNNPNHFLDPNWGTCNQCEAEAARRDQQAMAPTVPSASTVHRSSTVVGQVLSSDIPGRTKKMPAPSRSLVGTAAGAGDTRQIIGVLITYSWRPEGELFAIRSGKNFIGRGEVSSDIDHPDCDIQIPRDEKMSGEHALILCQQGRHHIIDQKSSNGTFLNSQLLMANQPTEIPNYASIQTGKTVWTYIKVEAPQPVEGVASSGRSDDPVRTEGVSRDTIVQ